MVFGGDESMSASYWCGMRIINGGEMWVRQTFSSNNGGMRFNYSIYYLKQ